MTMEDPREFASRPAYRKVGVYLLGLAISLLSVSILVYSLMMQGIGWPVDANEAGANKNLEWGRSKAHIQLYVAEGTQQYFDKAGGSYQNLLSPWQNYFRQKDQTYHLISQPEQIQFTPDSILVLPSAVALSESELQAIWNFYQRGGSLFLSWATGTRHADGSWRSWDFLEKVSNSKFIEEYKIDSPWRSLFLRGESPLTHELDSGQKVWLGNTNETFLRLRSLESDAWFLNKSATSLQHAAFADAAIIHTESTSGLGRVAVFCFPETTWEYQPHLISKILDGTFDWLSRRPILKRSLWPMGREAAEIVLVDVTRSAAADAVRIRDFLGQRTIPATYVVNDSFLTDPVWNQPVAPHIRFETLRTLNTANHEGPAAASSAPSLVLTRAPAQVQDAAESVSWGIHTGTLPSKVLGPQQLFAAGYRHQINKSAELNSRQPQFAILEKNILGDRFVIIPDGQESVATITGSSTSEAEQLSQLNLELRLTRESSSLGLLKLRAEDFNPKGMPANSIIRHLESMKDQEQVVWLATSNDVSRWWKRREQFKLKARHTSVRIDFDMTILGNDVFEGASLVLQLPQKGRMPRVKGQKIGSPEPRVSLRTPYVAVISFDPLRPGNYSYTATF